MIAILHSVRSLHNVGSIFRTADAAGIEKIFLCGITPAPVDPFGSVRQKLGKVSLGAEKSVLWEKVRSTSKLIDQLKNEGYRIFALEQNKNSISYKKIPVLTRQSRVALVVGNEVRGVSSAILKKADKIIELPMRGKKESLNVSVAFGIAAYKLIYG